MYYINNENTSSKLVFFYYKITNFQKSLKSYWFLRENMYILFHRQMKISIGNVIIRTAIYSTKLPTRRGKYDLDLATSNFHSAI